MRIPIYTQPRNYAYRAPLTLAMQFNDGARGYHVLHWINQTIYDQWKSAAQAGELVYASWTNGKLMIPTPAGTLVVEKGDWITYWANTWSKCPDAEFQNRFCAVHLPEE